MTERLSAGEACPRCSRRRLLRDGVGLTATALAVGGIMLPLTAKAASGAPQSTPAQDTQLPDPLPTPIPELDRFGHHNVPAAPYAEPSQIFDFNGVVAAAVLAGTGHDQHGKVVKFGGPGTDLRFMQGEYVTADGAHHQGTFLRIWLDLFPGSVSLPARPDQIHSYHPPIAPNGLYWTLSVPPQALRVDADATAISIELRDLALVDEPLAPLPGPGPFDARVSMKVTWLRQGFFVGWTDPTAQFHLRSAPARAKLEFEASTPSLNFHFKSDPGATSETIFAIIGTEQNGVFF